MSAEQVSVATQKGGWLFNTSESSTDEDRRFPFYPTCFHASSWLVRVPCAGLQIFHRCVCTFLHVHHEDFRRSRPCYPRWCLCVLREQVHTQISWPEECCSNQCPPQCWQEYDDGGCVRDQLLDLLFVYYCCILT